MSDSEMDATCLCLKHLVEDSEGFAHCGRCGQQYRMVPNGPDDYEWEMID